MTNLTFIKNTKVDLYQEVTNEIITALEQGTVPWLKPWSSPDRGLALPSNAVSGRLYSGINILLLWISADKKGYQQSKWITSAAIHKLGGRINKGEKATIVVNYTPREREKLDDDGQVILDEDGNPKMEHFAVIKRYPLFNIEQCSGLPESFYEKVEQQPKQNPYELFAEIRQMIKGMDIDVQIKPTNRACYMPTTDQILMPEMKQFESNSKFYSTLLHEMTHATGHIKRLAREGITSGKAKFGNQLYAMEELIAEIGCAFLCAHIGFDDVPQHAAYIDSWLNVLKADKKAIFKATGFARTACDYMLDVLNTQKLYENTFGSAERIAEVA